MQNACLTKIKLTIEIVLRSAWSSGEYLYDANGRDFKMIQLLYYQAEGRKPVLYSQRSLYAISSHRSKLAMTIQGMDATSPFIMSQVLNKKEIYTLY